MSILDGLLLASGLLAGLVLLAAPGRGRRVGSVILAVAALLAVLQLFWEGFYWQLLPFYALLALAGLVALRGRAGWIGRGGLALVALAALGFWAVLPVPRLPRPAGPYPVGALVWRWVDAARAEEATDDPNDRRGVIVEAFYPAERGAKGEPVAYIDGLGRLPAKVNLLPGFVLRHYGGIDTHAVANAAVAAPGARWPTVIFSPGYGAPRAFYTTLAADLASRGFVVLLLDHPYESAVAQLADGRLATPVEKFLPNDPDRIRFMEGRIVPRVGDVRYLLDRLQRNEGLGPLAGRVDLARVAAVGHSFGGATAALAMAQDPRLAAGADLDGMLYAGVERVSLKRPFLILESDHAVTHHAPLYLARAAGLLQRLGAPGWRFEIKGANHLSFTDGEFFFGPPARPALRLVLGGSRPAADTERAAADILAAFLTLALGGQASPEQAAAAHPGIVGGRT